MLKIVIKDFCLLVILSFIFTNIYGIFNVIFNFLIFVTYIGRITLSMAISYILYLLALYILSITKGYNLTNASNKFRIDISKQFFGTIIGFGLYGLIALILIFCPKGLQGLFVSFYYIGYMPYYCIFEWFDLGITTYSGCYTSVVIALPFLIMIRLLGLYNGRSRKIMECPALAQYDPNIGEECEKTQKPSWKDSIKSDE